MRSVITHIFNEEYLLPWWLSHHREMFDYGIIIDYDSTDRSLEICRDMVPDWKIIPSDNQQFSAHAVDAEVQRYESQLSDWKCVLNTTEFLCCDNLAQLEAETAAVRQPGRWIPAVVMADPCPDVIPAHTSSLLAQKSHGCLESEINIARYNAYRARLYHRAETGEYSVGRHGSRLPINFPAPPAQPAYIVWYGLSPWTSEFIARKLQIKNKISDSDRQAGLGFQHFASLEELDRWREEIAAVGRDMSTVLLTGTVAK